MLIQTSNHSVWNSILPTVIPVAPWNGPLGRARRRWEDGIRMDLGEIGLGGVDWIRLAQDRDQWRAVVSAVMNLRVLAPRS
jgi:hypothetical protein